MKLAEEIEDEIQSRVVMGLDHRAQVYEWILASCGAHLGVGEQSFTEADVDPALREAIWTAIEAAYAARTEEMRAWPAQTDCDRLRAAFDALEAEGIVALEAPGLTQDEGIPVAAEIAGARDRLEKGVTHGYTFFTWNDLHRAMDGEGLSLAYGTFLDEPAPAPPPEPEKCPLCHGRGWVTAADPSHGSTFCACQAAGKAAPAPPPPRAPDAGERVAAAVVAACRAAGLSPEWTGDGSDYIEFPGFAWQRRPTTASEEDVVAFLESLDLEIRAGYTAPKEILAVIPERAERWLDRYSDFGPKLWARLQVHAARLLEEEQERERGWAEPTMNDRITGAFAELAREAALANEAFGHTLHDGWAYAGIEATEGLRAIVFFHCEDVIDAMTGGPLHVAFGAVGVEASEEEAASLALGHRVVATLRRHGVACSWSGSVADRIVVEPFEWRRRRWTPAPSYELASDRPRRPSFFARLLGKGDVAKSPPAVARGPVSAPASGVVVVAKRVEGGFDLRRARRMRAAWKALGHDGAAQTGHAGLPHAFVPTDDHVAMCPRLAIDNLREERSALFARGRRSAEAKPK